MNNNSKIRHNAPGLAFLGTVRQKSLWGLAQVLRQVSTVQIDLLIHTRVRGHQFVFSVREINRLYMQYKIMSYSWITISFLHDKVVVQQKLIQWWSQNFISWAVIYGVVNTTMFLHEWVWGFGFHCYHLDIACFYYFITTHIRYSSIYGINFSI